MFTSAARGRFKNPIQWVAFAVVLYMINSVTCIYLWRQFFPLNECCCSILLRCLGFIRNGEIVFSIDCGSACVLETVAWFDCF